jgi:hypothetical protein
LSQLPVSSLATQLFFSPTKLAQTVTRLTYIPEHAGSNLGRHSKQFWHLVLFLSVSGQNPNNTLRYSTMFNIVYDYLPSFGATG